MKHLILFASLFVGAFILSNPASYAGDSTSYGAVEVPWQEPTSRYARSAGTASSSDYATNSGYSNSSGYAGSSGYSNSSGYAGSSGYANSAGYAGSSGYSNSSGYATTSGNGVSSVSGNSLRLSNGQSVTLPSGGGGGGGGTPSLTSFTWHLSCFFAWQNVSRACPSGYNRMVSCYDVQEERSRTSRGTCSTS